MHGRGYVKRGDKIAAKYLEKEFKELSISPLGRSYRQKFRFSVNTFPGKIFIKSGKQSFIPGKDFLVDAASKGVKGDFEVISFSEENISQDNFKNKFILIDKNKITKEIQNSLLSNPFNAQGLIIIEDDKLVWSVSQQLLPYSMIRMNKKFSSQHISQITANIKNRVIKKYTSNNIIAFIEGSLFPDSFIVFCAHYDHLGRMGREIYFPGANDNASGVAMLLNLAKHYSLQKEVSKYSIAFIAFAGEEAGLLGSKYFTEHPPFPLNKIKFLINLDLLGTGEEGLMVVNGSIHEQEYMQLVKINESNNYLVSMQKRGKAANSDHYPFSEKGVKAFFFYTLGGIKAYHDIYDKAETLPLTEFEDVFSLIINFVKTL